MKIIVVGMPRTATRSVSEALKEIGYRVYDFPENAYYLKKEWQEIFEEGSTKDKFQSMYKEVDAVVGLPASIFWEEIHKAFPDAKIILTVRDSEDVWCESIKNYFSKLDRFQFGRFVQIVETILRKDVRKIVAKSYRLMLNIDFSPWRWKTKVNETILKTKYRALYAHVLQNCQENQRLIFNCKGGWKPLCEFLNVPISKSPFPHVNLLTPIVEDTPSDNDVSELYKKELAEGLAKLTTIIMILLMIVGAVVAVFKGKP